METLSPRKQQAAATRASVVAAATARFGSAGYHATSLDAIAADLGATKGAVYHHFADKQALFRAVHRAIQRRLLVDVGRKVRARDPVARLHQACRSYLDQCADPGTARILLIDGPAALGWAEWRRSDERIWLGALRGQIVAAQAAGRFLPVDADVAARVISGSLTELVLAATGEGPGRRREIRQVLTSLLRTFEASPQGRSRPG